jgi:hypothetical protein
LSAEGFAAEVFTTGVVAPLVFAGAFRVAGVFAAASSQREIARTGLFAGRAIVVLAMI